MRILVSLLICFLLFSCNSNKTPDVSNIKLDLQTKRFEKALFNMDTTHFDQSMNKLVTDYPEFAPLFFREILNVDPRWAPDTTAFYIKGFISSYKPLYDSAELLYPDFKQQTAEIKNVLQYVKHYFPEYKIPGEVITYVGPVDGVGDAISQHALLVGLHQHMGEEYSMYSMDFVRQTYASYITRRFTPEYIPVNAAKTIVLDMYPETDEVKTLVVKMVESGKKLYCMQQLLPNTDEYLIIGYTKMQLERSYSGEAQIWQLFLQNNMLQSIDDNLIKNYIGDSPKTQELGEGSPGNIGGFVGWQIVKKYARDHSSLSLKELMNTPAETIFTDAKYKP
jgi:hypothetical protein